MNNRRRKKLSRRLVWAARLGGAGEVAALLREGAPAQTCDSEGSTPLYAAAVHGDADSVRLLLAAGALPDTESGDGTEGTPLCGAACWGHSDAVRELLAYGADPRLREDGGSGHSPLEWARTGPYPETVRLLEEAGA
ncbi:ankyrin repeat domain-containing protein [Streptomyces sp. IB2014 016-6]|uniref:ankyrin repeat domain-containing protein n=1 Tax=Streptomyces sp. IB2014 016-6 TaxID=2517818 RepID=UPI0011C81E2C|nr:ankyrin repeat domain-containing protein [Streptomyces sp. IB2014 016-6]TXL86916.1 ankyrin repeat domain-containing protein [Streptomyces sp. IB2014 016-6]